MESQATGIKSEYVRKVNDIDRAFVPDIRRQENGVSDPFENAYKTFCRDGIIPLVVGEYGETNADFRAYSKSVREWRGWMWARGDAVYNLTHF